MMTNVPANATTNKISIARRYRRKTTKLPELGFRALLTEGSVERPEFIRV
jgi:hypothetical protein